MKCSLLVLPASSSSSARVPPSPRESSSPARSSRRSPTGFLFTEGPATDPDGNIYFTDQPNDRIHKWTAADNKVTVFLEPSGRANGLTFDQKGRLVVCADEKNELWLLSLADKTHTVLVKGYEDKLLNGPNDAWVRPDGGLYFTDPFYKRPYWQRGAMEQDGQARLLPRRPTARP